MDGVIPELHKRVTSGSQVISQGEGAWRLEIPPGPPGRYRLAQLDDYTALSRKNFPWSQPFQLSLRARASHANLPGTWGFGVWNDPFSFSLGIRGTAQRMPALPNAAWFFFASASNYLSFRDDLPAQGFLAASFRSPVIPSGLLGLLSPLAALALFRPIARQGRRLAERVIQQDAALLQVNPTDWHNYHLSCTDSHLLFQVDGNVVLDTAISPSTPLGLVLWIDNQYAALPPNGKLSLGTLPNPTSAWIELADLLVRSLTI